MPAKLRVVGGMGDKLETVHRESEWTDYSFTRRRAPKPNDRLITVGEVNRLYIPKFTVVQAQSWRRDMPARIYDPVPSWYWWESEIAEWVASKPTPKVLAEHLGAMGLRRRHGDADAPVDPEQEARRARLRARAVALVSGYRPGDPQWPKE